MVETFWLDGVHWRVVRVEGPKTYAVSGTGMWLCSVLLAESEEAGGGD